MKVAADDRSLVEVVHMFAGEDHSLAEAVEVYMIAEVGTLLVGGRAIAEADRHADKVLRSLGQASNCVQDDLDDRQPEMTKSTGKQRSVGCRMAGYAGGTLAVCPSVQYPTRTGYLSDRERGTVQVVP